MGLVRRGLLEDVFPFPRDGRGDLGFELHSELARCWAWGLGLLAAVGLAVEVLGRASGDAMAGHLTLAHACLLAWWLPLVHLLCAARREALLLRQGLLREHQLLARELRPPRMECRKALRTSPATWRADDYVRRAGVSLAVLALVVGVFAWVHHLIGLAVLLCGHGGYEDASWLVASVSVLQVPGLNWALRRAAIFLTRCEDHRSDSSFQRAYLQKSAVLQLANTVALPVYVGLFLDLLESYGSPLVEASWSCATAEQGQERCRSERLNRQLYATLLAFIAKALATFVRAHQAWMHHVQRHAEEAPSVSRSAVAQDPGEQQVVLRLDVTIKGAAELPDTSVIDTPDPYCVCEVKGDHGRTLARFRTRSVGDCLSPEWNHRGSIRSYTPGSALAFTVKDSNLGRDTVLGAATLDYAELKPLIAGAPAPRGSAGDVPCWQAGRWLPLAQVAGEGADAAGKRGPAVHVAVACRRIPRLVRLLDAAAAAPRVGDARLDMRWEADDVVERALLLALLVVSSATLPAAGCAVLLCWLLQLQALSDSALRGARRPLPAEPDAAAWRPGAQGMEHLFLLPLF
ncbi:unnamed protein product [Prorocentrum cordatum]|uniref:C2 domain-containing protein n=1 Tax=Prorocentrum cordatum TaxID=2364126 RepID=A0ABN9U6Z5_9DINO|nr:unnamed protein product [Polarella glacialis]